MGLGVYLHFAMLQRRVARLLPLVVAILSVGVLSSSGEPRNHNGVWFGEEHEDESSPLLSQSPRLSNRLVMTPDGGIAAIQERWLSEDFEALEPCDALELCLGSASSTVLVPADWYLHVMGYYKTAPLQEPETIMEWNARIPFTRHATIAKSLMDAFAQGNYISVASSARQGCSMANAAVQGALADWAAEIGCMELQMASGRWVMSHGGVVTGAMHQIRAYVGIGNSEKALDVIELARTREGQLSPAAERMLDRMHENVELIVQLRKQNAARAKLGESFAKADSVVQSKAKVSQSVFVIARQMLLWETNMLGWPVSVTELGAMLLIILVILKVLERRLDGKGLSHGSDVDGKLAHSKGGGKKLHQSK